MEWLFQEIVPEFWVELYHYAWFISFAIAFAAYALLMKMKGVTMEK